jgi:hypothetical protein
MSAPDITPQEGLELGNAPASTLLQQRGLLTALASGTWRPYFGPEELQVALQLLAGEVQWMMNQYPNGANILKSRVAWQ